ncbi:MAG TPA: chorismate synthase [Prolixibacteraceae bacterium]|nr:chorismate synthase [Lentimicrobium sp.]HLN71787.1 chorismate synthase [Prolixibacteraceae bacterium]
MNSFGRIFRVHIFGESHGINIGVVIDGCPAGIPLTEDDLEPDLARRRAGAEGTTPRKESDIPKIVSGTYNGRTTGAPLTVLFENMNTRSEDYEKLRQHPRPGHADYAAMMKFNKYNDPRGGGHFSARITLGLVVAGAVAKKILGDVVIKARVKEVGGNMDIEAGLKAAIEAKDSVGGLIECVCTNLPIGLGEPFFDSVESAIAHIAFAIPAVKGIEFGSGFEAARMYGSQNNDLFIDEAGTTATNNAGGINGGLTNGNDLIFRLAIKPASSISLPQQTFNFEHKQVEELVIGGRHDVCVALRAPVIVEAAAAIVLADFALLEHRLP